MTLEVGCQKHVSAKDILFALCPHTPKHIGKAGHITLAPANQFLVMRQLIHVWPLSNLGFKPTTSQSLAQHGSQLPYPCSQCFCMYSKIKTLEAWTHEITKLSMRLIELAWSRNCIRIMVCKPCTRVWITCAGAMSKTVGYSWSPIPTQNSVRAPKQALRPNYKVRDGP
jgi:hypothetical protein